MPTNTPDVNHQHLLWIYAVSQGNKSAFEKLYQACSGKLLAVAIHLLGRRDLAEEILQEVFVKIWHNASHYHSERGNVVTWMISIVRNRCIDELRHQKVNRKHQSRLPIPTDINTSVEQTSSLSESRQLQDCVDLLEGSQRQSIQLAYFYGLTHLEITEHISAPLGTIKSWIKRGLDSLKRCLKS